MSRDAFSHPDQGNVASLSREEMPVAGAAEREAIIFVHGSLGAGDAFAGQEILSTYYDVRVITRHGYTLASQAMKVDHDKDVLDLIEAAGDGAHLVGTSTGALIAAKAAASCPEAIRSLTLIEPPAFAVAADIPSVASAIEALKLHWEKHGLSNREFMAGFLAALKMTRPVPKVIPPELDRAISLLRTEHLWAIDLPVGALSDAGVPVLVVAGGWSPAYDAICHRVASLTQGQLTTITGFGHAVQKAGPAFNDVLEMHLRRARRLRETL